jgi:hypothetical protein
MIHGTMERSQPGCHSRTACWSRRWWPRHDDCPGSANCSPEQGGVPTAQHHVMMIGDLLMMLQKSETMQRSEIRRPLDGLEDGPSVHASRVLPTEQHHV